MHAVKELPLTANYILCILRHLSPVQELFTASVVFDRSVLCRVAFGIVAASISLSLVCYPAGSAGAPMTATAAFADDRCRSTTLPEVPYVQSEKRDTLEQYAATLRRNGKPVALAADHRSYGKIYVVAKPHAWALWEEIRSDSTSYTLRPTDSALMRYAITTGPAIAGSAPVRTKLGFKLGDPIASVTRAYGNGSPRTICGLSVRGFAGPGRFGDWYALYGADDEGKIAFVKTGDVSTGIRHLWQQAR
jgi:hypothetical protein